MRPISPETTTLPQNQDSVQRHDLKTAAPSQSVSNAIIDFTEQRALVSEVQRSLPAHIGKLTYWNKTGLPVPMAAVASDSVRLQSASVPTNTPAPLSAPILHASEALCKAIYNGWADSKGALVYNFDMELDDLKRLENLLPTWKIQPEASKAALILVAGQRTGGDDTFEELVEQVAYLTGAPKPFLDERISQAQVGNVWVLRGAPLKMDGDAAKEHATDAAQRLKEILGGRSFIFHNNTSEVLFAHLPTDAQAQCRAHICTCDAILAPQKLFEGANYRWDPAAYRTSVTACQTLHVPFVSVHGSTLGFGRQTLSELPDWAALLQARVADPKGMRKQVRFAMQQVLQWTGRIYGAFREEHDLAVSSYVGNHVQDELNKAFGSEIPPSCNAWAKKPQLVTTYSAEDCTVDSAGKRARAIPENLGCPVNNTIGDFAAAVLDGPKPPKDVLFIPVKTTFGTKDVTGLITLSDPNEGTYMAVQATEEDLIDIHQSALSRASAMESTANGGEMVVDLALAREWQAFVGAMKAIIGDIMVDAQGGENKEQIRQHLQRALVQLEEGPMSSQASVRVAAA